MPKIFQFQFDTICLLITDQMNSTLLYYNMNENKDKIDDAKKVFQRSK